MSASGAKWVSKLTPMSELFNNSSKEEQETYRVFSILIGLSFVKFLLLIEVNSCNASRPSPAIIQPMGA
jgi:hypothetical protein